ncbi:MAG: hypothetical protein JJT94_06265 [Bernardetiaceae bacterium]|nr:hypothetical protein [Bernardetiaceae bacterium]
MQKAFFSKYSDATTPFGGENYKKFTTKRFRNTLLESSKLPFSSQEDFLKQTIQKWMGDTHKQIDDILVLGFKI